jgi:response regulator RpfG family c-di-GMP phosphodiesterase
MLDGIQNLIRFSKTLKILYVEDNINSRTQTKKMFDSFFSSITIGVDGVDGLAKFKDGKFDLVISDINMPNMNGIDMISSIRKIDKDIPIIILSAYSDSSYFLKTIQLGIDGYLLKPIKLDSLVTTLSKSIETIKLKNENQNYKYELETINTILESQVEQRVKEIISLNQEIQETQKEVIYTMGTIAETRSKETGKHVQRVAQYSELFALYYGLSKEYAELLKQASPMHDIGKVGIADAILNKPGKLTDEEFEIMKTHSQIGYDMLKSSKRPLLKLAATVAHQHHEKYDGSGYPQGLKGEDIDISGRITAISDVFDALGSKRVYKDAWDDDRIFKLFMDERGKHFDPKLVDIFFDNLDKFLAIRDRLKDSETKSSLCVNPV